MRRCLISRSRMLRKRLSRIRLRTLTAIRVRVVFSRPGTLCSLFLWGSTEYRVRSLYAYEGQRAEDLCRLSLCIPSVALY